MGDVLEYVTMRVKPWTAVIRLSKTSDSLFEAACHEGNYYSMQDALSAGRADEAAAAMAKRPSNSVMSPALDRETLSGP
jgi:hypothetical protein